MEPDADLRRVLHQEGCPICWAAKRGILWACVAVLATVVAAVWWLL